MSHSLLLARRTKPSAAAEAETFGRLYQEHTHALFNYCLYRLGDATAAEDLVADTFERAWRARRRYNPRRAEFVTWLFAIARHSVTDSLRRQARRPTARLDERLPNPRPGPDLLAQEADDRERLRALVRGLPAADRELIALKFGAGLPNRQIARIVGKSESAVGSAVYRLVQRLRLQWEETR